MHKILIAFINYNCTDLILKAIESISESNVDYDFIVLDNASRREEVDKLVVKFPGSALYSSVNLGFTKGLNYVINHVNKEGLVYEFLYLMNPDAISSEGLIEGLLKVLKSRKRAMVVSPKILDQNGEVWFGGGRFDLKHLSFNKIKSDKLSESETYNGCSALFRWSVFQKVGLLDDDIFMYYDEAEFSHRIRSNDFEVLFDPRLSMVHYVSTTPSNFSYMKLYYMTRNVLYFTRKVLNQRGTKSRIAILRMKVIYTLSLTRKRKFEDLKYFWKGVRDFKKGRMGKIPS
ncbi:MAG: glycosyltransferase family 2 protein [Cytophagia bacterium]|nr:glycosyltransferase family 2 protein [Cytophagia bacterium]